MARDTVDMEPISRDGLVEWIAAGEKSNGVYRLGTEHEKFPFYRADNSPVPYAGPRGISGLLAGMQAATGWEPILEDGNSIGLFDPVGGAAVSLEPGGQFELSGAPLDDLHQTAAEFDLYSERLQQVAAPLGINFLGLGMSPKWTRAETPVMPKSRYRIMMGYMPKVGTMGLDMMFRTSTVQVNLDFGSEADMVKKLRVSIALQPVATALFANSPFTEGRLNGFKSYRSHIWTDTDNQRAGMLPFVFEDGFGYERYVDYALDVPMYFVKREDYRDVTGQSFRDLLNGTLASMPGERATKSDWVNHVSTIFPEVRLKRYLEMRGADMGSRDHVVALSAFWVGLLYNADSLDAAWDMVKGLTAEERQQMRLDVPRHGLETMVRGRSMRDIARQVLMLSRGGLSARARRDFAGRDETGYLDILDSRVAKGASPADDLIAAFNGRWGGSVEPAFREKTV